MIKSMVFVVALAGVSHADTPDQAKVKALEAQVVKLEARVKKLEDYTEALEFLQKVYVQQKAQQQAQDMDEPAPNAMFAVDVADSVKNGHVQGAASAGVTIVWAFDLADPYSARMQPIVEDLVAQGKVRVVYKHMIVHPQTATTAHKAACAAGKQQKFAAFYRAWWDKGYQLSKPQRDANTYEEANVLDIAKGAGLDIKKLKADMNSPACDAVIQADMAQMQKFHVNATPTFFINGKVSAGAQPRAAFEQLVDDGIAEVARSGVPAASYYAKVVMTKGEKQFRSKANAKP